MKNINSKILFEKTLDRTYSSQPFTIRLVKQEIEGHIHHIVEKLVRYDAMNNQVWMPVDNTEQSLVIEAMGEFFENLHEVKFKDFNSLVDENLKLRELIEVAFCFHHHKENSCVDYEVTGQGERFLKKMALFLFEDYYPEDSSIEELIKKHKKLL